jgi:hypothetical protein
MLTCQVHAQAWNGSLKVVEAGDGFHNSVSILSDSGALRLTERLRELNNPGAMGISEWVEVTQTLERAVGKLRVVELHWSFTHRDQDNAGADGIAAMDAFVTWCLARTPTDCSNSVLVERVEAAWGVNSPQGGTLTQPVEVTPLRASVSLQEDGTVVFVQTLPHAVVTQFRLW